MSQQLLPMDIRLDDLADLVRGVAPVAGDAGSRAIGAVGDLEGILNFVERVVPLFNSAAKTILSLKEAERGPETRRWVDYGGGDFGWEGETFNDDDGLAGGPPRMSAPPGYGRNDGPPPAESPPEVATASVDPDKAFAAICTAMVDLDKLKPGITIKDALATAHGMREVIVPRIAEELKKMGAS